MENKTRNKEKHDFSNSDLEEAYLQSMMRHIKHSLVLIAFGVPTIMCGLKLLAWHGRWDYIYSNLNAVQLLWCTIVPFTITFLVFTESYGESIRNYKYYHCVTFIFYELISVFSIFTYCYSLMRIYSCNGAACETLKNFSPDMSRAILNVVFYISVGHSICALWAQNTVVHISLCRYELFATEPSKTQYDYIDLGKPALNLIFCFLLKLPDLLPFILSLILTVLSILYDDWNLNDVYTYINLWINFFSSPWMYSVLVDGSQRLSTSHWFMDRLEFTSTRDIFVCIIILEMFLFFLNSDVDIADSILFWFCCLSMGRQWYLDMEICPEKYENHFMAKLGPTYMAESQDIIDDCDLTK